MEACKRICSASFPSVCFGLARRRLPLLLRRRRLRLLDALVAVTSHALRRGRGAWQVRLVVQQRVGHVPASGESRAERCGHGASSEREARERRPWGGALVLVVLALGVRRPPAATQRVRAARARRVPRGREATTAGQRALRAGDVLAQRVLQRRLFLARSALAVYRAHHRVGHRHRGRHVRGRRRRSCAGAIGRCHVVGSCLAASGAAVLSARPRDGAGYKKCRERR